MERGVVVLKNPEGPEIQFLLFFVWTSDELLRQLERGDLDIFEMIFLFLMIQEYKDVQCIPLPTSFSFEVVKAEFIFLHTHKSFFKACSHPYDCFPTGSNYNIHVYTCIYIYIFLCPLA